jgi:phenylacetate-CoA ligase
MVLYKQVRDFERLSRNAQDAHIAPQLRHLLQHAKRYSPFWSERLASWRPQNGSCRDVLQEIPPLVRSEIQSQNERLLADFPNKKSLSPVWVSSSGSTGTPVRAQHLQKTHNVLYLAMTLLIVPWHGFDPKRPMGNLSSKVSDRDDVRLGPPFRWLQPTGMGFRASTRERRIDELYDYCASRNPTTLQCGPAAALELARYAIRAGRRDLKVELILTLGSVVTEEMRQLVREALGAKMIDRYSCEETGYIALQCPKHDHLHVMSPMTFVEIVDDQGEPCSPGKVGRVLLTAIQSYGMPLIRYEIGDLAEWGEPCDCGITMPVIKKIWGRTKHVITHPNGEKSFARIYARDFESVPGLEEYRFVLHRNSVIAAQLKVSHRSPETDSLIIKCVQRSVGYPYPVRLRYVDEIDWGDSPKRENFSVSEDPPPDAADGS